MWSGIKTGVTGIHLREDLVIGEVKLIVQTTGVPVTEKIVNELLAHHVLQISASGIDHHHDWLETQREQQ
jgi:hypothetical protein